MFAANIPTDWIKQVLNHCEHYDNSYLFQTKNPERFDLYTNVLPSNSVICTTIETNRSYIEVMGNSPSPYRRADAMRRIKGIPKYVTIEPIMDFDLPELVELIRISDPIQVNIGADSGGNLLPEPSFQKIKSLISELEGFTKVELKFNLTRL